MFGPDRLRAGHLAVAVVVPRRPSRGNAVDSQMIAAAELAQGFVNQLGATHVLFLTEEGQSSSETVLKTAVHTDAPHIKGVGWVRHLPPSARVHLADAQALRRKHRLRSLAVQRPLGLVVQFHHRFQDIGLRLARQHSCPLVLRVEALEVAEQRSWGLRGARGGWLVERLGERRILSRADVVAPVSESLAGDLRKAGVPESRLLTLPNGVNLERFRPTQPVSDDVLGPHGLCGRFLIGWVGGFRPYHGLGQVEEIVSRLEQKLPMATLCLLGEGPNKVELEAVQRRHPLSVRLVPGVAQPDVPAWLARFDVCLQLADPTAGEHYSPLKLLEYLACGRPVVAPDVTTASILVDGRNALLYPPNDTAALVAAICRLYAEADLRARLGMAGVATARSRGSWESVASQLLERAWGDSLDLG
jgi:glycosyltransferase involved in cell wall biosynthesis